MHQFAKYFLFLIISCCICIKAFAQQNCMDAIPICQNSYSQSSVNAGVGSIADVSSSSQGCLTNGEVNATWYILNASTSGNIVFDITPNSATDDYDFAIWDITDISCTAIANGLSPLRCNFASLANSSAGGITGLNTIATQTTLGGSGPSFCSAINAVAGQTFVILVNNNSASTNGYNINFAGSTAQIIDNVNPTIKNVIVSATCGGPTQVKVLLKENVKCSSIAINGSDFSMSGGYNISGAVGISCASGGVFSSSIVLTFNTALAPGTYTITINNGSDGNTLLDNCNNAITVGTTFAFTVLPPIQLQVQPQFGCSGSTSGTITAFGSGGYLPYKFKLNNGVFNLGNSFASLSAGTYTIFIKDSLGCVDDTVITLSPALPIGVNSIATTNLTCYNSANGTITINAIGGNPPLLYAVNSQPYTSSNVIASLAPGTYVVHTKDANGCIKDTIVLITSPGIIVGSTVNITNVSCLGLNNGSIIYTAIGGTLPLQYALNNGSYTSFANYNNLPIGSYTLHIKDVNNCTKDTVINIVQPSTILSASIANIIQPNCNGGTGTIVSNGGGGTSPYLFSINGTVYTSNNSFSSLASGTYTIYVKDAGGCITSITALLSSPGNLSFTGATILQPTCISLGTITTTAAGGIAPLTFAIGTGAYSAFNVFGSLSAGSYTLHVKDNNNCIHDTIITLSSPALPQIAIASFVNTTCSAPNSGSISVVANGGSGAYLFSMNGGAFGGAISFANLVAGIYTIVVKDVNGCTASATANIISNNTIAFGNIIIANVGCGGAPLGSITATGIGGNSPYQYQLNTNGFQSSGSFVNIAGGTYTITTKDAGGCTKSTIVIVQSSASFAITNYSSSNATCSNPGNGSISAIVSGGVAPVVYNLNGSNAPNSNFSNLSPGTYTFTATDANGCTITSTSLITGPPKLWFTNTVVTLPPCFGGFGSISTNGIGGLPAYTFSLNTNAYTNAANYTGLPAGTYTVHLQDANGCIHDTIINLIQPNPVLANNLTVVNTNCTGGATGSISVIGAGTVGPYLYNINNGVFSTVNTFTNLGVGTYSIAVKDANACTANIVASINNNGNFYFNTSSFVLPLCVNATNGSITFSGSGGALPYTYKINATAYQVSNTFNGLLAGIYTLYVKDNAGCEVSQVLTLPNPNPIVLNTITINSPSCFNGTNGSINVVAIGGTGAFLYSLDGGTFSINNNFTGLSSGVHTINIKDANACTKDSFVTIINPLPIGFANIIKINPGCFGPGNGSIIATANGGNMPYNYKLNAGVFSTNNSFNPLLAGSYTITIQDANSCTNSSIISLVNSVGVGIAIVAATLPTCPNTANGIIAITATTLNAPLVYNINNGANITSNSFSNLPIGIFTIHVTDALGCYKDTVVTLVTQSNLKIDSAKLTPTLCFGDSTGSAKLYASGGSGLLSFAYNNFGYNASNVITGLASTIYTLHAKDGIGCMVDTVITIGAPLPLYFASSNLILPFCNGSQDGTISISAGGGSLPYQYGINANPFSTSTTYNNLIQGIYTFYIQDAHGCLHDTSIFLQGPDIVYFSAFTITDVTCFGASDGGIIAVANGGIAPYQYSLNNNAFSTANTFASLPAGQYNLVAIDNQGCIKDTIVDIIAPSSSVALQVINVVNNKCRGDSTGSILVGGLGGTAPYQYSFNTPTAYSNVVQYNSLAAGAYSIFIKDAKGCTSDSTISIAEPDSSVQIYFKATTINSCIGVYDATLSVSVRNGFAQYTYYLNTIFQGNDSVFYNLSAGDYVVEVIDSIGCKSTGKYKVDSTLRQPFIAINNLQNNICNYDSVGKVNWQYIDAYAPVQAFVNGGTGSAITSLSLLPSGNYTLQMIDAKGCKADTTFAITYFDSLAIVVSTIEANCSGIGDDGKVSVVATGSAPFIYTWSVPTITNSNTIDKITYGKYAIMVTDSAGCVDSSKFVIEYYPCCTMWLPNVFTPNKDGNNDKVIIKPSGPVVFKSLDIFNRFGNKVFTSADINTFWDGTYNGQVCDIGTYYYLIRYNCPLANKEIVKKGDITLYR